ncbi:hypothetical protein Clacol_005308 [Clathrus columnatus]|uniref:LYC1 C-terminal domain-containing protein n=1 Tax=Clathrus columnatus TaxID=1419009 RepID=A0AAV5ABK7_9AGAM|nr:hypothetical protein Clacol_005308 [Clathrus columnatus]
MARIDMSKVSLFEATSEQDEISRKRNYAEWAKGLDLEGYLRRDKIVDTHEHAVNGKLKTWVLASVDDSKTLDFFCACETFQRQGLIQKPTSTEPEKVIAYGISSVYCPPENRGKGYAIHMMRLLHYILAPADSLGVFPEEWGSPPIQPSGLGNASFSMLWSEIGGDLYERAGYNHSLPGWKPHEYVSTVWQYRNMVEHFGRVRWLLEVDCVRLWDEDAIFVEKKFSELGHEEKKITCAFLPNGGVAAFQIRRVLMYLPGSPHLPIPKHWGVEILGENERAYATWVTEIGSSPASLTITRLRTTEKTFPIILSAIMEAAKQNCCTNVEIWNLDSSLNKIAMEFGGEGSQSSKCLPSLAWYGPESAEHVKFLFNENSFQRGIAIADVDCWNRAGTGMLTKVGLMSPVTCTTARVKLKNTLIAKLSMKATAPFVLSALFAFTQCQIITLPPAVSSGFKQEDLDRLWQSVEQILPVTTADVTEVLEPLQNFSVGPDPPRFRPAYLQANTSNLKLPEGFKYGVATAATQVEGAVKTDGRGPSNWDWACHNYVSWCNNIPPDVTINHYYLYKRDIQRAKAMGVNTMSFSISWSRVFPFGLSNSPVNEEAFQYYDSYIDELLANDIEPVVTLFHWDTPLNLISEYHAFLDGRIVDDYANYAETIFRRYGNKVNMWITFNEPKLLKAHATAVQRYRSLKEQGVIADGQIALKHDGSRPVPFDPNSLSDNELVERHSDLYIGIFSQPIYGNGNYPDRVLDAIPSNILPRLTPEDQALIKGSADFYAIDAYTTQVAKTPPNGIEACAKNISDPNWPICQDVSGDIPQYSTVTGWALGAAADPLSSWLGDTSSLLRYQLNWLYDNFPAPGGIYISEFGFAEPFEYDRTELYQITWDERRATYLLDYLNEALLAIYEDGIPLKGTFIWSLADNYEWNLATQQRFGLQHVNYSTPDLQRSYKLSFFQEPPG